MSDDRDDPFDRLAAEYHLQDPRTRLNIAFGVLDRARRDAMTLASLPDGAVHAHPSAVMERAVHYQSFIDIATDPEADDGDE